MFNKLTDISYTRSKKEAFGFYLAYLLLALIIGGVVGALLGATSSAKTFEEGFQAGSDSMVVPVITLAYVIGLSILIFIKKNLQFRYLILTFVNAIFVIFGGAILGLILPAFMTTRVPPTEK